MLIVDPDFYSSKSRIQIRAVVFFSMLDLDCNIHNPNPQHCLLTKLTIECQEPLAIG